jgi:hypothetical protein
MSTQAAPFPGARRISAPPAIDRITALAAIPLMLGVIASYAGFAWDVQWHSDVGPDTFFTLPHLVLYSGIAITGLTCLAVTLAATVAARRGDPATIAATTPVLRGRYRAPLGYLVSGFGALAFLLYGAMDEWWHGIYGFDVTLISPPHVGLILSIFVIMSGALAAFAGDARRAVSRTDRWRAAAAVGLAAAVLFAFLTPTMLDVAPLRVGPFNWVGIAIALLYPCMLVAVLSATRLAGAATLAALLFSVLLAVMWVAVPWATGEYAASIGLFMRDSTTGIPVVPGMLPTFLLAAGLVVDGLFLIWRRNGWQLRTGAIVAGAVAGVLLVLLQPLPPIYGNWDPGTSAEAMTFLATFAAETRIPTLIAAAIAGGLSGWFGWNLGILLRRAGTPAGERPVA